MKRVILSLLTVAALQSQASNFTCVDESMQDSTLSVQIQSDTTKLQAILNYPTGETSVESVVGPCDVQFVGTSLQVVCNRLKTSSGEELLVSFDGKMALIGNYKNQILAYIPCKKSW